MSQNDEELVLFETIMKGRKCRCSPKLAGHFNQDKYKYYKRSFKGVQDFHTPSSEDMLHTASLKTQAIFKISSFGKGTKRIAAHLSYISRRGELELEDHIGNKIVTLQDQKEKLDAWAFDFGDGERARDTMQIVLSTPPGTNFDIALNATREFLKKEFKHSGHEYLFVQHTDTDHPHVHAVIKMMSCYGNKINPRKVYLHRVRQHFAAVCRSYGIQVEASSRAERGLSGYPFGLELIHVQKRSKVPQTGFRLENKVNTERRLKYITKDASEEKIRARNQLIKKRYADRAKELIIQSHVTLDNRKKHEYYNDAKKLFKHGDKLGMDNSIKLLDQTSSIKLITKNCAERELDDL